MTNTDYAPTAPNPDFAATTIGFIMEMPISSHFGFSIAKITPGSIEITQPYRRELSFREGAFQAGAIGTLADFAGAGACVTRLPKGWGAATSDYTLKLLAPANGEKLVARGRVVTFGRTLSVATADRGPLRNSASDFSQFLQRNDAKGLAQPLPIRASHSASVSTVTPSSRAAFSFEPESSPATT